MIWGLHRDEVESLTTYDPDQRRVSIFADSEAGRTTVQAIADSLGARALHAGSIDLGCERLNAYPVGDAILVDVAHDSDALDMFLAALDARGRLDRVPLFVNSAPNCLDQVVAQLSAPSAVVMSAATAVDWLTAMATMVPARDMVLNDAALEPSLRLQRLADEVQRIALTLSDLMNGAPSSLRGAAAFHAEPTGYRPPPGAITADDVRGVIRLRRMRDRFFRSDLFADPAWDMLLDLMAARLDRVQVAVSSLCIAAAVPPTTALRWIKALTENGMFIRVDDPGDGRRVFIELSDGAAGAMTAYLSAAKAQGGLAI